MPLPPNQKRRWRLLSLMTAAVLALALAGCSLDDRVVKAADAAVARTAAAPTEIVAKSRQAFADKLKTQAPFAAAYQGDIEQQFFVQAEGTIKAADQLSDQLKVLVKKDDDQQEKQVENLTSQINAKLDDAVKQAATPSQRLDGVLQTKQNITQVKQQAAVQIASIRQADEQLKASATTAAKKYPQQTAAINQRTAPFYNLRAKADKADAAMQQALKGDNPNYAVVMDSATILAATFTESQKQSQSLQTQLADLDVSITKTLVDMKVRCTIRISRTSWDESSDWDTDKGHQYQPVSTEDAELCNYWADFDDTAKGDARFATWSSRRWSGKDFQVDKGINPDMWKRLGLRDVADKPSSHNEAEFYLEGVEIHYFQKLAVTKNGVVTQNDFVEVDEETFDENEYDLGMDILSKDVGEFADQASEEASPAGMMYVGNPQYGHWEHDSSSNNDFWVFYGQYRLFSDLLGVGPGGYVYRSDWDDWNRNYRHKAGYYGSYGGKDKYGTLSPQAAAKYPGSNWVKSHGAAASVRGAGPAGRAGGPGGGGK